MSVRSLLSDKFSVIPLLTEKLSVRLHLTDNLSVRPVLTHKFSVRTEEKLFFHGFINTWRKTVQRSYCRKENIYLKKTQLLLYRVMWWFFSYRIKILFVPWKNKFTIRLLFALSSKLMFRWVVLLSCKLYSDVVLNRKSFPIQKS